MPTKLLALLSLGLLLDRASSYQPPPPPSSAVASPPSLPTPSSSASRSRASRALFPRSTPPTTTTASGRLRGLVRRNAAASASSSLSVPFDPLDGGSADLAQSTAALNPSSELTPLQSRLTKIGLTSFILSMCLALPLTLLPLLLLEKAHILSRLQRERYSLRTGCFCARWLMRLIPFAKVKVVPSGEGGKRKGKEKPEPSVWVCNHTSMLDVFVMLAVDKKLRGRNRRPIKIVYWKGLEKNPVTKILFTMSGFISVEMADNGSGNANEYNKSSFRPLLKSIKQAFAEGFDVGLLPEGQLNPTPELGLLPVFSGAFTLARMSKRQIRMMALYGVNHLWSADESVTSPTGRDITVRAYPPQRRKFGSGEEFGLVFKTVVGHFGATGRDVPNLDRWLDGSNWREMERRLEEEAEKDGEGGEE